MRAYRARFPVDATVRVADVETLRSFARPIWKLHHPLASEQLALAGQTAVVARVTFFHGGDVLYELVGVPGTWHEACLRDP